MSWKGTPDPDHIRTLFVLFPRKVKDREEIKKLHPGIEEVRFKHRAHRWCHMKFKTVELAKQAAKELHKKKIKHGRLIVSETKIKRQKELEQNDKKPQFLNLFITNIPKGATKDDVKSAFKTCKKVSIKPSKRSKEEFKAIITMQSFAEAQELFADKESHKIKGVPVTVNFSKRVMNIIQDAKSKKKGVKIIGRKELEEIEIECDTSLNKVVKNIDRNSHASVKDDAEDSLDGLAGQNSEEDDDMENSEEHESEENNSEDNDDMENSEEHESEENNSEDNDDDMENSEGHESN